MAWLGSGLNLLADAVILCYVYVMTIRRITISVSEEVAHHIKRAAKGMPVSTWITDRLKEHLDEAIVNREWEQFYEEIKPTPADRRRAKKLFGRLTNSKQRGKNAA